MGYKQLQKGQASVNDKGVVKRGRIAKKKMGKKSLSGGRLFAGDVL